MTLATAPVASAVRAAPPPANERGPVTVERYGPELAAEWDAFLEASNNGTLFHDLRFLAYHAPERFDTHHLVFRQAGKLVALLPAAVVREPDGQTSLKSPYGASVGGCVLPGGQRAETTAAVVHALQDYALREGLGGIEMRTGPNVYAQYPNDGVAFALTASGFSLTRRWLCHVVPLPADPAQVLALIPTRSRRRYARYALRQGVTPVKAGVRDLGNFYRLLEANRAKHGAQPTHTLAELERLFRLVPDRVTLFLFTVKAEPIAGALVFELNRCAAYMFYLCHDEQFEQYRATTLAVAHIMEQYAARGFRYLDLGPSTFDDLTLNRGLAEFKEEMGATGFCRDTYRWEAHRDGA
jgi:hypothetical protein